MHLILFRKGFTTKHTLLCSTYPVKSHMQLIHNYASQALLGNLNSSDIATYLMSHNWLPDEVRITYKEVYLCHLSHMPLILVHISHVV